MTYIKAVTSQGVINSAGSLSVNDNYKTELFTQ
jgi:hypothetical protein